MNKFFPFLDDDVETVFSHVLVGFVPKAIGRGKIIAVVIQNPLTYADGTQNTGEIFVGSASNQIYFMIPGQESPPILAEDLKDIYVKLKFPFPNPNGGILDAAVSVAGEGYTAGDVLTLDPAPAVGTNATITVLTVGGPITGAALNAGGAGYGVGNVLNVTGGLAEIIVDTVDGGGAILTFHISNPGTGYQDTVANATTGGAGAGATFDITTPNGVLTFNIMTPGTAFVEGSVYDATGGTGVEAAIAIVDVEIATPETADVNLFIYRRRLGGKQ